MLAPMASASLESASKSSVKESSTPASSVTRSAVPPSHPMARRSRGRGLGPAVLRGVHDGEEGGRIEREPDEHGGQGAVEPRHGVVAEAGAPALVHDAGQGAPDVLGQTAMAGRAHQRGGGNRLLACLALGGEQAHVAPAAQPIEQQASGAGPLAQRGHGEAVGSDVLEHVGPADVGHQPGRVRAGLGVVRIGVGRVGVVRAVAAVGGVVGEPELGLVVELDGVRDENL